MRSSEALGGPSPQPQRLFLELPTSPARLPLHLSRGGQEFLGGGRSSRKVPSLLLWLCSGCASLSPPVTGRAQLPLAGRGLAEAGWNPVLPPATVHLAARGLKFLLVQKAIFLFL